MKGLSYLKRITAFLLTALIAVSAVACSPAATDTDATPDDAGESIRAYIAYDEEDGLNPFAMSSFVNRQTVSLLYRSLFTLSTDYSVEYDLAEAEVITGKTVEVAIRDAVFSDGRPVLAEDVIYSFEMAKKSPLYAGNVSDIILCEEKNPTTVIFRLENPNVNVLMGLTFPIVKKGTAENTGSKPIGCGNYRFNVSCLEKNPYCEAELPADRIEFVKFPEGTEITNLVDSGDVDFYYNDLSSGETVQSTSASTPVYLNNLIYLGVNGANRNLSTTDIRRAVSLAIDRRNIVDSAFQGNARPACVPFNTSWKAFSECAAAKQTSDLSDKMKASALLKPFGIGQPDEEDPDKIKTVELTLIYPDSNPNMFSAAMLVKQQLEDVNINISLKAVASGDYQNEIVEGNYDLYIGEIKIRDNMDITQLMNPYGNAAWGISYYLMDCDEYYIDYVQGDVTIDEFLTKFLAEMPFIPLCFRNGRLYVSSRVSTAVNISESRLYGNISSWTISDNQEDTIE